MNEKTPRIPPGLITAISIVVILLAIGLLAVRWAASGR